MPNSINRRNFIKSASALAGMTMIPEELLGTAGSVMGAVPPVAATKFKGISIHIGVNRVNPAYYDGWSGLLTACEADAIEMEKIAISLNYETMLILTKRATVEKVKGEIEKAAKQLHKGDILFITYSGHGMQVYDKNEDEKKSRPNDKKDEAWVLYNGGLLDDELYALWHKFDEGVRIVVVSDSCHSGTIPRKFITTPRLVKINARGDTKQLVNFNIKGMPAAVESKVYQKNRHYYDGIQLKNPEGENVEIKARLWSISACQDEQLTTDGKKLSLFTSCLVKVWEKGNFRNYNDFYQEIASAMKNRIDPGIQEPNRLPLGRGSFESEFPFSI